MLNENACSIEGRTTPNFVSSKSKIAALSHFSDPVETERLLLQRHDIDNFAACFKPWLKDLKPELGRSPFPTPGIHQKPAPENQGRRPSYFINNTWIFCWPAGQDHGLALSPRLWLQLWLWAPWMGQWEQAKRRQTTSSTATLEAATNMQIIFAHHTQRS